jgi:hypothetical protein
MGYTPPYGAPSPRIPPYIVSECQFRGDNPLCYAKKFLGKKMTFFGVFMNMNLQENIDRIKKNMGIRREYIDWDENYGKAFRIVHTPQSAVDGEWNSDLISVVTPENGESFYTWEEVPFDTLMSWRENWDEIQRSLGDYKYKQIIRSKEY